MYEEILITQLNDFIFCPVSIYFHQLYGDSDRIMIQSDYQINGTAAHENIDNGTYSTRKEIVSGISVYSEKYGLVGKIDVFDTKKGKLVERKRTIKQIYDGYVFQVYAQCFSLREMGYEVNEIVIHSITDNKNYKIDLPEDNPEMLQKFEKTIYEMHNFEFDKFVQSNSLKCKNCIYEPACDRCVGGK